MRPSAAYHTCSCKARTVTSATALHQQFDSTCVHISSAYFEGDPIMKIPLGTICSCAIVCAENFGKPAAMLGSSGRQSGARTPPWWSAQGTSVPGTPATVNSTRVMCRDASSARLLSSMQPCTSPGVAHTCVTAFWMRQQAGQKVEHVQLAQEGGRHLPGVGYGL